MIRGRVRRSPRWARAGFVAAYALVALSLIADLALAARRGDWPAVGLEAFGLVLLLVSGAILRRVLAPSEGELVGAARGLQNIVDSAPWGVFVYRLRNGRLVLCDSNPSAGHILGVEMRGRIGKTLEDAFPLLAGTEIPGRYREVALTGERWTVPDFEYRDEAGGRHVYEIHAVQTVPGELAVTFVDVTSRSEAAAEIGRQRDFSNLLIDSLPGPFLVLDAELRLLRWNRNLEQLSRPAGHRLPELIVGEQREELERACRRALEEGHAELEVRWLAVGDGALPFQLDLVALPAGGEERLLGIAADLSGLRRAEEQRDRLFNYSIDMLCVAGFDGYFKQLNPAWKILGWPQSELLARPWIELVHPDDREATVKELLGMTAGRSVIGFENRYRCADGSYRWLSWNSYPLPEEQLAFAVVRDVSEKKRVEAQLQDYREHLEQMVDDKTSELERAQRELLVRERMAALGRLTATVSHELRNPLGVVRGSVFALERQLRGTDPAVDRQLDRAARNLERCEEIVDELLTFTRRPALALVPVVIDPWLEAEVGEMELPEEVALHLAARSGAVAAIDRASLRRALINLVTNAVQAMASLPPGAPREVWIEAGRTVRGLEIRVRDTGPGIAPEVLERIFEPLFSTKPYGVGLGLSIVRQTLEQHHGGVDIDSAPGRGTTVTLWVPLGQGDQPAQPAG